MLIGGVQMSSFNSSFDVTTIFSILTTAFCVVGFIYVFWREYNKILERRLASGHSRLSIAVEAARRAFSDIRGQGLPPSSESSSREPTADMTGVIDSVLPPALAHTVDAIANNIPTTPTVFHSARSPHSPEAFPPSYVCLLAQHFALCYY